MNDLKKLWEDYNAITNRLTWVLGRTNNVIGEYAEHLTLQYYGWYILPASNKSADIKCSNGKLIQIKARKINKSSSTQLGIIRSWDFHLLVVILFNSDWTIIRALEVPVETAKKYAVPNEHQNGWIITTTKAFLHDDTSRDITYCL